MEDMFGTVCAILLHKKSKPPLKGQFTDGERQPQELKVVPAGMAQNVQAKTSRTINVNEQPPATQFTTKYTAKHNALFATGWEP